MWGNCFVGKFRDADGRVEELLPLDPSGVTVQRRDGRIVFTVTLIGVNDRDLAVPRELGVGDLIHIKALTVDGTGLYGLPPIKAARPTVELNEATRTSSTALFANNARPSGILAAHRLNADQAAALKAQWTSKHGADLSGGIAILSAADITFTPLSMPADDAQYQPTKASAEATREPRFLGRPPA